MQAVHAPADPSTPLLPLLPLLPPLELEVVPPSSNAKGLSVAPEQATAPSDANADTAAMAPM
jgi:hypothetical protein